MKEDKKKVVLAFSGGLDTSFAVKYLSEDCGYEVYTAIANTGGFSPEELKAIEKRALDLGAKGHATLDITQEYYDKSIKYMIFGNVLRNGTYPISVSSERIFQAIAIIQYAKSIGAKYVAHGSTSAGNDQVRFDLTSQRLNPPHVADSSPTILPTTERRQAMKNKIFITIMLTLSTLVCCGQSFVDKYPKLTKKNLPEFFEDWQAYSDSVARTVNCHSDICNAVNAEFDTWFHVIRLANGRAAKP